jgi:hypothetical protein
MSQNQHQDSRRAGSEDKDQAASDREPPAGARGIAPLDGGLLETPPDAGDESESERLKREAAAEEHQERDRAGTHGGKI